MYTNYIRKDVYCLKFNYIIYMPFQGGLHLNFSKLEISEPLKKFVSSGSSNHPLW